MIFDGDYPVNVAQGMNADLTQSIKIVRSAPPAGAAGEDPIYQADMMASVPEQRLAGIVAFIGKLVGRIHRPGAQLWGHRSSELAYSSVWSQIAYYRIMERRSYYRILSSRAGLSDHMKEWEEAAQSGIGFEHLSIGVVLGMEGADPVLDTEALEEFFDAGLRVVSLTHYDTSRFGHGTGTGTDGGLLPPADWLLADMGRLGIVLDATHASDATISQALERFDGSVIATHQNCRAIAPGERQFPDQILRSIIDRAGIIGVSMDTAMLYREGIDWANAVGLKRPFSKADITLSDLAEHVDHICQLSGNAHHVGIGGDTDGQGGRRGAPAEIDTVADYRKWRMSWLTGAIVTIRWPTLCIVIGCGSSYRILLVKLDRVFILSASEGQRLLCVRILAGFFCPERSASSLRVNQ